MDNSARMMALQAKGGGAPPQEPPMAPPAAEGDMSGGGGMPPPEVLLPKLSEFLVKYAGSLPDQQKQAVLGAAEQLKAASPSNPSEGPMDAGPDSGESEATAGM